MAYIVFIKRGPLKIPDIIQRNIVQRLKVSQEAAMTELTKFYLGEISQSFKRISEPPASSRESELFIQAAQLLMAFHALVDAQSPLEIELSDPHLPRALSRHKAIVTQALFAVIQLKHNDIAMVIPYLKSSRLYTLLLKQTSF